MALAGCVSSKVRVTSEPSGARIVRNGLKTSLRTPAELSPFNGSISVEYEGYKNPEPLAVSCHVAGERVIITLVAWPVGAIIWGFQFQAPEQDAFHFTLTRADR